MITQYYSLLIKEHGTWGVAFGDYERECVEDERTDILEHGDYRARDLKIIKSGADQSAIDAAVAKLNG